MKKNYQNTLHEALSYEALSRALFENYESLYVVDIETSNYQCFHESSSYRSHQIEEKGEDFFRTLNFNILKVIYYEDQKYARKMLSKAAVLSGIENEKYYSFVYRLLVDGQPMYHKFRATKEIINNRPHILIGIRNIDKAFRKDKTDSEKISAMYKKEKTHLEAILSSSAGYLEANLSKDILLEINPFFSLLQSHFNDSSEQIKYSELEKWRGNHLVVENREKYLSVSNREYLIDCFIHGERRASVSFSIKTDSGSVQPCRKVFYLYKEDNSCDIMAFCVLYDLTEQQRKEKELVELEQELRMSRIRNSTSQMQPHFLYNVLGSIQEIMLDDPNYASELLDDFMIHLRGCIRGMENDLPIPFSQELSNIKAYVHIEKMRLGNKLRVIYEIENENFPVLPLSIQPIVENAIRHGIYERGNDGGTVTIYTEEEKNFWKISVEDTGVGFDTKILMSPNKKSDSTGLKNLIFRLDKVMHAKVEIKSRKGKGTTVTVLIPKEFTADESNNY